MRYCQQLLRRLAFSAAAVACTLMGAVVLRETSAGSHSPAKAQAITEPADPVALLSLDPGMNPNRAGRPVLAIWPDGTVIFAFGDEKAGRNLQVGTIPSDRVGTALAEIEQTGIFGHSMDWNIVPDGSFYTLALWKEGKACVNRWNQALTVPWGVHTDTDAAHASLAKSWMTTRAILALACPSEYKALDPNGPEAARLEKALQVVRNKPIRP